MKKSIILFLLTLFFISNIHAQSDISIVHGPYKTDLFTNGEVYFEQSSDINYPIRLILKYSKNNKKIKLLVDQYEHNGAVPEIKSIFFHSTHKKQYIFVIVTWEVNHRAVGIYGDYYQVYAYIKNKNGELKKDNVIIDDVNLSGMEGTSDGYESHFKYKTANEVIKYINENYK